MPTAKWAFFDTTMTILYKFDRWVGSRSRVPINLKTGYNCNQNDPKNWLPYAVAKKKASKRRVGLKFAVGGGIVVIDLDDCIKDGVISRFAQDIIEQANSYTVFSASGCGIHIYLFANLEDKIDYEHGSDKLEIMSDGFAVVWTGNRVPNTPSGVKINQALVDQLVEAYKPPPPPPRAPVDYSNMPEVDEVQSALSAIPLPMPYHDWVSIVLAVQDIFNNDTGISLIVDWSGPYFKHDEDPYRVVGSMFRSARGSGITKNTLFGVAYKSGWQGWTDDRRPKLVRPPVNMRYTPREREIYELGYQHGQDAAMAAWREIVGEEAVSKYRLGVNEKGLVVPFMDGSEIVDIEYRHASDFSYENGEELWRLDGGGSCGTLVLPDSIEAIGVAERMYPQEKGFSILATPHTALSPQMISTILEADSTLILTPQDYSGRGFGVLYDNVPSIKLPAGIDELANVGFTPRDFQRAVTQRRIHPA